MFKLDHVPCLSEMSPSLSYRNFCTLFSPVLEHATLASSIFVNLHRGEIIETLSSFTEGVVEDRPLGTTLPTESAGCLGGESSIDSLPRRATTVDMVGLSVGSSCTHKSPI